MLLNAASTIYAAAATWRRRWYARDPSRRRRLARPVISIGNLRAGGSGKTPAVAHIAQLLVAAGERPAILSRGYGRRHAPDGVTVVSDGSSILAGLDSAGDEPLMLARALGGVPVLVCRNRYLAGCLAERRFGVSVHLLDDGFQHLLLVRDIDLVVAAAEDLSEPVLPAGLLREPLGAAAAADAVLTPAEGEAADRLRRALNVETIFQMRRMLGRARWVKGYDDSPVPTGTRVIAVTAIAHPERFFNDLVVAGWDVATTMAFRDHHHFTAADVDRIALQAGAAGADLVMTTEKDAVRLEAYATARVPMAAVPLHTAIEPRVEFSDWLLSRVGAARAATGREQRLPGREPLMSNAVHGSSR